MKRQKQIQGSALPVVLVLGTLMLLAVLALLGLSDIETWLSYGNQSRIQKEAWLESAMVLYERDSILLERLDEQEAFTLFDDEPTSVVTLNRTRWGLYELIRATTDDGKIRRANLMGYQTESPKKAALYVCDNRRAFTLAGKSNLKGTVHLPENGILYGQVQSDFYTGDRIAESQIRKSGENMPGLENGVIDSLRQLLAIAGENKNVELLNAYEKRTGFFEPKEFVQADSLFGTTLYGNIVVCSPFGVEVDSTSRLEDILIVAPQVVIREGFSGTLQIIASDSVLIEKNVRLKYPSGIIIPEGTADSYIEIGESSEVNGYVIFRTATDIPPEKRTPHYAQQEKSRVRGLLWVDGIAQLHGTVTGSLYVNQANYYTPQGYYMNLLYNTRVYRSEAMVFPVWMQNDYPRKTAKWLY